MRVNIIGAGITGLAAAHYLSRSGHAVKVFEGDAEVGGLSGYFSVGGSTLEKYYHHIFSGHKGLLGLMEELGLQGELTFKKARMGLYYEGRIYPFVNARDLIRFTPLRFRDRVRLGFSSLLMMRIRDWRSMEKRGALEWLRTYSGEEACRVVWEPLLRMKFGDHYDRISAAWLWNRVLDRRKSKESGGGEELGYIQSGYKKLFDALSASILKAGGEIRTSAAVRQICMEDGRCTGLIADDSFHGSDLVLATVPVPNFLNLVPHLPEEYLASLRSIRYQGSTCVVLKSRKALSSYYWVNISDPRSPFVGVIEHTNFIAPENYGGRHLIYLTRYSQSEDTIFSEPHDQIYERFVAYVQKIFPEFRRDHLEQYWVFQDRFSQPVFETNYSCMMPANETPVKNLFLLDTAHFYPESRCLNTSILKARALVDALASHHS